MDKSFAKWFSLSTVLVTDIVAEITDEMFSDKPCIAIAWDVSTLLIQCSPITHSSTGSKPDSCHLPCDIRPDIMLMPDALDPSSSSVIDVECMPIRLKLLIPSFVSLDELP